MNGGSSNFPDGGLSEQPVVLPAESSGQTDQRWTGSTPLKVASAVLVAFVVAVFSGNAIASASLVAAVIVPIALFTLATVGCYRLWRTSVELASDGTLVVRNLLRTYHIPIAQIFSVRRSEYGIRITLLDGRIVTAGVLQTGRWRQRSRRPDQAAKAISAITQAVDAARSARPAESMAAIDVTAPLRAKRMIRNLVVTTIIGPMMLIASFFVPAAGIDLAVRLRWIGSAATLLSLAAAYSLLRLARPGASVAYRHRRRR
jgi:hypothetical protein